MKIMFIKEWRYDMYHTYLHDLKLWGLKTSCVSRAFKYFSLTMSMDA